MHVKRLDWVILSNWTPYNHLYTLAPYNEQQRCRQACANTGNGFGLDGATSITFQRFWNSWAAKSFALSLLTSLGIYSWLWEPGNRPMAVIAGLLTAILVSIISIGWQARKRDVEAIGRVHKGEGVEFFPTIDDLRMRHPLPETFKPGNEIHAYLLSGEGIFAEHNDYIKSVKRLILPNPEAENVSTLQTFSSSYLDYRSQIPAYRALAKQNHVPVRLFQSFTGVSLLFCNPDRQDGWVQVGIVIPGSESSERHHYRLYKNKHERAFLALYKTFNRLWDSSSEQTEDEAIEEGFRNERER